MKELLEKYIEGNVSDEELKEAVDILKTTAIRPEVREVMYSRWKACEDNNDVDPLKSAEVLHQIHHRINLMEEQPSNIRRIYTGFSRIAAILVIPLLIFSGALIIHTINTQKYLAQTTVNVPLGATSQLQLPDGTKVWLNSGTTLTYPLSFRAHHPRLVELHGEAFFKVAKDKTAPFIVDMADMDIKVTGTTFNARAYDDEAYATVALVEGSVDLGNQTDNGKEFTTYGNLIPYEVAFLDKKNNKLEIQAKSDLDKYTAWREGRTVFDNDPIEIVADKFEKLFNVNVKIENPELLQYRFTATFVNETLERALKILSISSPISYKIIEGNKDSNGAFGQRTILLSKASSQETKQ